MAGPPAAQTLHGTGWKAGALRTWSIEIFVADLDPDLRDSVVQAQSRQRMINPAD